MLFQIASSCKILFAVSTAIWRVVCVCMHVELQIGQFIKSFLTQITGVRLLASVDKRVISQVAFLMKTLAADFTHEFFNVTMSANVCLESG